jgi:hypothetical protein
MAERGCCAPQSTLVHPRSRSITMSKVTKIEIHFTSKNVERVATITVPKTKMNRHLQQILLVDEGPFNSPMPADFELNEGGPLKAGEGPDVCYVIDGQMVCW